MFLVNDIKLENDKNRNCVMFELNYILVKRTKLAKPKPCLGTH